MQFCLVHRWCPSTCRDADSINPTCSRHTFHHGTLNNILSASSSHPTTSNVNDENPRNICQGEYTRSDYIKHSHDFNWLVFHKDCYPVSDYTRGFDSVVVVSKNPLVLIIPLSYLLHFDQSKACQASCRPSHSHQIRVWRSSMNHHSPLASHICRRQWAAGFA